MPEQNCKKLIFKKKSIVFQPQEFDKTALFVEFQNKPSIEDIKHFLQAVKGANTVKLGK